MPMPHAVALIACRQIDAHADIYRISTQATDAALQDSIRALGLLHLPYLLGDGPPFRVISGFRRIAACQAIGYDPLPARIVKHANNEQLCACIAVSENALQRKLNLVEMARALALLGRYWQDPAEVLTVAARCGLPVGRELHARLKAVACLPPSIQQGLLEESLALPTALELGKLPPSEHEPLTQLLCRLRLSLNKQRELLTWVREIGQREGLTSAALLSLDSLQAICNDERLDRNQKGARIRQLLWQRRYPALSAARREFSQRLKSAALTQGLQLAADPNFESPHLTLTMQFQDLTQLQRQAQALERLLNETGLASLVPACPTPSNVT